MVDEENPDIKIPGAPKPQADQEETKGGGPRAPK